MTNTASKKAERIEAAFSELMDLIAEIEVLADDDADDSEETYMDDLKMAETVESDEDWNANMQSAADRAPGKRLKAKILKIKALRFADDEE